jgi:hypothetical protein
MNTAIYQGQNISKINFKHFSTLKVFGNYSIIKTEKIIEELFNFNDAITEMAYSIERFKAPYVLHTHILTNTNNENMFYENTTAYIKPKYIRKGHVDKLVKILKNENDEQSDVIYKDVLVSVPFVNYIGNKKEMYIENVVGIANASLYTFKFCNHGINNGYHRR